MSLYGDLRVGRLLVRSRDASELLDLAGTGLLIQALGIALLSNLEGHVNEDLDERDRLVAVLVRLSVQIAGEITVRPVGRDEGGDGDGGRVSEELGDLSRRWNISTMGRRREVGW